MEIKSKDLLVKLSPAGAAACDGPGTLREKWALLTPDDKLVLEQALAAAGNELKDVTALLEGAGLLTLPAPVPTPPTTAPSADPTGPTPPGSASSR